MGDRSGIRWQIPRHARIAPGPALHAVQKLASGAGGELAQQIAIEAAVQPQAFGDRQDDLPVGDGKTDVLGHVDAGEQCPLLVAGGAGAALFAGEGHEHLMMAVAAADAGEALVQIAALEVVAWLKKFDIPVSGTLGFNKAEVTAGGVALGEVDSHTMESRLAPGLYFAGEVLDIDGPIGGYNFQAAFSTGWLAGENA